MPRSHYLWNLGIARGYVLENLRFMKICSKIVKILHRPLKPLGTKVFLAKSTPDEKKFSIDTGFSKNKGL